MSGILRAVNLSKGFGSVPVLRDLDLEIPQGSIFGLIGPNGAGKTTTLKIAMNILQPTSGRVEVLGVDSRHLRADDFRRIGYVSENQELPGWMSVDEFMAYLAPFYPSWDDRRAAELVRQFGLPGGRKLRHLSRGMWMKAALASSLAYRPELLVLDEPFSGLDPLIREELIEGVLESARETTIFISSHDLGDIESFVSHVGYLDAGRLQFSEEMESLSARFREVEVAVAKPPSLPGGAQWPANWICPEAAAALVRFVETRFDPERTTTEVRRIFGDEPRIAFTPMPLRAIFVTLARSASKTA